MAGPDPQSLVCIGAIAGAFGVRGEVRIKPFTDAPEAIGDYGPLYTEDGARCFEISLSRSVKGGLAVWLSGVKTREQAEAMRGTRLFVPRAALPDPEEEDDFYHADLVGLRVEDLNGADLGKVRSVQNYGAGDFLEIFRPGARRTALLPFTLAAVPKVDVAGGRIIADPPVGVFEDDEESRPARGARQARRRGRGVNEDPPEGGDE
ncbi:MAG: ribosome maturation factor RimM [Neomegalonema sp.]|nr:ribosome maturation factor RimM [Neomegalonema sp.]